MRSLAVTLPVCLDFDLVSAGWDGSHEPYPGITPRQFAFQSIRSSLVKKFLPRDTSAPDAAALKLFLEINAACGSYSPGSASTTEIEAIALGEMEACLYDFFYPAYGGDEELFSWSHITSNFGLGNGANIGSYGTDFLSKVGTSHMCATSPLLHSLFVEAISSDPTWARVESTRSLNRSTDVVRGSRLSFVPKTTKISRTICTEPILNMLFQKGAAKVLEGRLEQRFGISLKSQPDKNRKLAQLGSISERFGTIDLSSASDSMSIGLVKRYFPRQVSDKLMAMRCPSTVLPDGAEVELHMISSMGNAFTFPLQTIFFASVVYGVYRALGIHPEYPRGRSLGNFAVFGDDIVVVREAYDLVSRLLCLCGFSVNVDKSFNSGLFRESCGHDYYNGSNVRGVYIRSLDDDMDAYSAINRLNRWSAVWCCPLPFTIHQLLRGRRLVTVPMDEQDVAGIKVPFSMHKTRIRNKFTGGFLYRYLSQTPTSYDVRDVLAKPPKLRGWFHNPDAVLLAALASTLRLGKVATRSSERRNVKLRVRYSSSWDYIPPDAGAIRRIGDGWKSIFEENLTSLKFSA